MLIDEVGCWVDVRTDPRPDAPALFLDRDGVIVEEVEYLSKPEDATLILGAAETIAAFNTDGVPVVVVTNQSGVGRGFFDWATFAEVQRRIDELLSEAGARVDAVLACGYCGQAVGRLGVRDHHWRKPRPGMLIEAASRLGVDLSRSWMVGDRARDLEAAASAGLAGGILVGTGHFDPGERAASDRLSSAAFDVIFSGSISGAACLRGRLRG